ncbi:MAG: pyridoxamine 5'-phosphate oxidase family protein [Carboxylicivirga sp.]|jgi:nitroimidazol reductase NimA-like FMN-containing flavoprotein (pyridoxamine 5'-phosphate oxidase superfamily)|nr:pyridoxamine 5'-phosphate oxidase family protein [Carboxylicivirga sp.]
MQTLNHTDKEVIEAIILKANICFVGVVDQENKPYVLPMNYGYKDNVIYLHSAPDGRLIDIVNNNPNICITFSIDNELVFQHPEVACSYRMTSKSVVAMGKVQWIEDMEEKREALDILMKTYSEKQFKYSDPAVRNVKMWKIPIDEVSCKEFGAPHDQYKLKRNLDELKQHPGK